MRKYVLTRNEYYYSDLFNKTWSTKIEEAKIFTDYQQLEIFKNTIAVPEMLEIRELL